ncbi:MAG TPA: right-handed parallel beta-helix repeat-containing protein [Rhodanobacteraceae bacterium]|nr:right-handed parallel beta-helix repeat-containing protein [Rhodanobacteraceae bacterium]
MRAPITFGLLALFASGTAHAQNTSSLTSVDTYGTFESGGVTAVISGDANGNATAQLEELAPGSSDYRVVHPLVRVDATHFVGSLFWLQPGNTYGVRVTLSDPDGVTGSATMSENLTTRAEDAPFTPSRTLYVAPNGSDGNSGTNPSQPLKTIGHAADIAQAGDLVSIGAGIYYEDVYVSNSGTASAPIVFRGSAGAIVDGSDPAITAGVTWTNRGNGVWSYATGYSTDLVVTDQGRLFDYSSLADLQALAAGAPGGEYADGTNVYVKFSDGSSPAQRRMNVSRFDTGFYIDGASNVRVQDLEIRYYGSDEYGRGVYLRYTNQCEVSGSNLHENGATAVWIKGGARNVVEDNDIGDTSIINWPWALTHASTAQNTGVYMTDNNGQGNVIRRNQLHGTYDGMHPCGSSAPDGAFTTETDVYDNTIWSHADDAIESEGYCSNVRIWNNTIKDSLMAVAVAPASPGPTWIVRNTAYDIGNVPSYLDFGQTPSGIKINSDYSEVVGPLLVYHNTFLTTVPGVDALVLFNPGYNTYIFSRNNVFDAPHNALRKINSITVDFDFDDMYSSGDAALVNWYNTNYPTLASVQTDLGEELHGISADPALANPAGGDFTPNAGSPLLNRAVPIPGINDAEPDGLPDIGAVERIERSDAIFANGFD